MRNITTIATDVKCFDCKKVGYFTYTESNWLVYEGCPCCGKPDIVGASRGRPERVKQDTDYKWFQAITKCLTGGTIPKHVTTANYCPYCKIIFTFGCTHSVNGCSYDIGNGHLVRRWRWREKEYYGMPKFDSVIEWYNEIKNIEILEWTCGNNGIHCTNGYYSKDKYPTYYDHGECKACDNNLEI